jgi:tetratricopeptide (TPR) repeat protein
VVSSASEDSFVRLSTTDLLRPAGHDRHHFAHALIQEVVYGTILRRRRGEMHREVAEAIERVEGLDPDTVEIIAEHHAKSDHPETAPHYLELAGDLAERRSGFAVARDRYERALRLSADDVGAPRLRLLQKLAGVTLMTEHAAALAVIDEAIRLARKSGDRSSEAWGLAMQGRALTLAGDTARAVDALESAIQQLEGVGSREKVVQSLIWLLAPLQMSGRVADGKDVVRRGLELADRLGSQAARSHLLNSLGVLQSLSADPGGPDQIREALAIAEDVGDPDSFGRASMNLCVTISWFDPPRGLPLCRPATERLRELGMSGFASYIAAAEGYMLMALGRFDEAIDACNALLTSSRRAVIAHGVAFAGMALTHAYTRTGRYEDAREAVDACLPVAIGMGVALSVPVLVARAEMSVALGHSHDARASIEQALDVALASEARSHHLWLLAPAARLLGPDPRIIGMLEEPSSHAGGKWATARIMETEALLEGDPAKAAQAADRYADLRFPFEEATCRLMEGQPGRARELIDRHGLSQAALEAVAFSTVAKDNLDSRQ